MWPSPGAAAAVATAEAGEEAAAEVGVAEVVVEAAGVAAACRYRSEVAAVATRKFHLIKSINFTKYVLGG